MKRRTMHNVRLRCQHDHEEICLKAEATFRVLGPDLDPDKIKAILRVSPTTAYAKGDAYQIPRVGQRIRSIGHWSFCTEGCIRSTDIEAHALYLLRKLEPCRSGIHRLLSDPKYHVSISLWWEIKEEHGVMIVSRDTMKRLTSLCQDIEVHFIASPTKHRRSSCR